MPIIKYDYAWALEIIWHKKEAQKLVMNGTFEKTTKTQLQQGKK